jgi:hypothetical protein
MSCPPDQIVIVTGEPRSGTSAMMRALDELGHAIAGDRWPHQRRASQRPEQADRLAERARKMNPCGFYEIPGVVANGLADPDGHGGRAVKIISRGLLPAVRGGPERTPPDTAWRVILCCRAPRHVADQGPRSGGRWIEYRGAPGQLR